MRPSAYYQKKSVDVTCKWDGVGTLSVLKLGIVNLVMGANSMRYTQLYDGLEGGWSAIYLSLSIRTIRCVIWIAAKWV